MKNLDVMDLARDYVKRTLNEGADSAYDDFADLVAKSIAKMVDDEEFKERAYKVLSPQFDGKVITDILNSVKAQTSDYINTTYKEFLKNLLA